MQEMSDTKQHANVSSRAAKFVTIAERRTQRVLAAIRLLGQCSNRRTYEYSPEQVDKIFREIRRAVRETEHSFRENSRKRAFRL